MDLARRIVPKLCDSGEQLLSERVQSIVGEVFKNISSQSNKSDIEKEKGDAIHGIPSNSTEYLVYNKLEAIFAWLQPLVLWHCPLKSILALVVYHYLNR